MIKIKIQYRQFVYIIANSKITRHQAFVNNNQFAQKTLVLKTFLLERFRQTQKQNVHTAGILKLNFRNNQQINFMVKGDKTQIELANKIIQREQDQCNDVLKKKQRHSKSVNQKKKNRIIKIAIIIYYYIYNQI